MHTPNMTAQTFRKWFNADMMPKIDMGALGFVHTRLTKGMYVDGHDKQDNTDYRNGPYLIKYFQ